MDLAWEGQRDTCLHVSPRTIPSWTVTLESPVPLGLSFPFCTMFRLPAGETRDRACLGSGVF